MSDEEDKRDLRFVKGAAIALGTLAVPLVGFDAYVLSAYDANRVANDMAATCVVEEHPLSQAARLKAGAFCKKPVLTMPPETQVERIRKTGYASAR